MLDHVLVGGQVLDGTGRPAVRADIGIRDSRIVAIGSIDEPARHRLDITGLTVAPGFIDPHTHYDAQAFWDPGLSPSPLHGVTTVMGGNCGFTIAPIAEEHADYLMRMLAWVEGMPLQSLSEGVPWGTWSSVGEWLDLLDGTLAVNAGFLAGHSAIRRVVMGEGSVGDVPPTEAQMVAMEDELRRALHSGAMGFSSSNGSPHVDGDGTPVPSRWAHDDEMIRLCRVLRDSPGTALEYIPAKISEEKGRMAAMSHAANRPLNWNLLAVDAGDMGRYHEEMSASDLAATREARIVALTVPMVLRVRRRFDVGFGLSSFPDWGPIFHLSAAERIAALQQPEVRERLRLGAARATGRTALFGDLDSYRVEETFAEANDGTVGMTVRDIARQRGHAPFDTLMDIVVADELRTTLLTPPIGDDQASWDLRSKAWHDPNVLLGGSDAGAHIDILDSFTYFTDMLGNSVREHQRISLEAAVHLLTDRPARLYGLKDRGRVAEGWLADLVVFDPATVGPGPVRTRHDLPGGAGRLYAEATGIEHVFVNGVEVVRGTAYTGARPGTVLRSGRDTEPVAVR